MQKWQRVLYQPNLPLGKDGKRVTACKEHRELSKQAAKEGMVLLKNENHLLPLKQGAKIALFGKGTFDYVKGGGGSGDVTVSYTKNLYDGFSELSEYVTVYEELADFYREDVKKKYKEGIEPGMLKEPELSENMYRRARNFTDTAVISICRFSGEGWDRKSKYDKKKNEEADNGVEKQQNPDREQFPDGDFYLSETETILVEQVKKYFPHIIVVLNVGGMVDTNWFANDDDISSVLMAWQGGMEGGSAAAELLCGIGNPSGKLADTFAKSLEDYPSTYHFHESDSYVNYTEDIYVGYRYFETIPGAKKKVNYPFGFGLSYTEFHQKIASVKREKNTLMIGVQIVNAGDREGKEVVQVYGNVSGTVLGRPKKTLLAFKKTRLLKPGEQQTLTLTVDLNDMASYDDLGKIQKSAYILEKGEYIFFVGNSVRHTEMLDYTYFVKENKIVKQLTQKLAPSLLKERMTADGSMEELPQGEPVETDACVLEKTEKEKLDGLSPSQRKLKGVLLWSWQYKEGIRPFSEVAQGEMSVEDFLHQMTDEELVHLLGGQPNTGVANTFGIGNMPEYSIPNVMTADGPAGLRIDPNCGVHTTAWPCATLLASTWNEGLLFQTGLAGAREVKENNIAVWLTPAVNIHRSPLCGRNFEYYSEDPFLTGKMAASFVRGVQSQHIGATVKHFALNNKETNRKNSDSRVSERAAREIYLKAFEIIVKEAKPWCVMTSYNIINGHRASENKDLLSGILRDEWGFDGMVTSDWWTFGEHYKEAKAGNDLKMACGDPERLLEAKSAGAISREELEQCAAHILEMILKLD
jgi:beta-glucosidase